jgi:hypothetical protein
MKRYELGTSGKSVIALVVFIALFVAGCAGPSALMKEVPEGEPIGPPETNKAMVVFLRPSGIGFAVQAKIIDVTSEDNPKLVGFLGAKTKIAYQTEPGEVLFMVMGGENTPFLKGNLEAGETYYAKVSPLFGILYARFTIKPIHGTELDEAEFVRWYSDCTHYRNSEESYQWAGENMGKIKEKRGKKLPGWMKKPQDERDALTLNPDDGRP